MAAPQDAYLQVAPDSTGKAVDNQSITPPDGITRYRQTVTLGDPTVLDAVAQISADNALRVRTDRMQEVQMLQEASIAVSAFTRRHSERATLLDSRGSLGRGPTR